MLSQLPGIASNAFFMTPSRDKTRNPSLVVARMDPLISTKFVLEEETTTAETSNPAQPNVIVHGKKKIVKREMNPRDMVTSHLLVALSDNRQEDPFGLIVLMQSLFAKHAGSHMIQLSHATLSSLFTTGFMSGSWRVEHVKTLPCFNGLPADRSLYCLPSFSLPVDQD